MCCFISNFHLFILINVIFIEHYVEHQTTLPQKCCVRKDTVLRWMYGLLDAYCESLKFRSVLVQANAVVKIGFNMYPAVFQTKKKNCLQFPTSMNCLFSDKTVACSCNVLLINGGGVKTQHLNRLSKNFTVNCLILVLNDTRLYFYSICSSFF